MHAFVCIILLRYMGTGLQCKYISHYRLGLKSLKKYSGVLLHAFRDSCISTASVVFIVYCTFILNCSVC